MPRSPIERPRSGRVFIGVGLVLLAVAGLSAGAVRAYARATTMADHTLDVRRETLGWLNALVDAETGVRGYVASGDPSFLEPYTAARPRERQQAAHVHELLAGEPLAAEVDAADRDARRTLDQLDELVTLTRSGHRSDAVAVLASGTGRRRMDTFRRDADVIRGHEADVLASDQATARRWARTAVVSAAALTLLAYSLLALAWRRERAHRDRVIALAGEARGRLLALSGLAAALAGCRTRREVAEVIVEQCTRATGADTCTLYELDAAREKLTLVANRGCAPEVLAWIGRITATDGNPALFATMQQRAPVWVESEADYARLYPELAAVISPSPRGRAFWCVPLAAEDRLVGVLGVGYCEPRAFPDDERSFIETLCRHAAESYLRASRFEHEDQVRRWLDTTLRSIGDAVIATDEGGRVSFMNPVAEELTGWPEAEARGRPLEDVFSIVSEVTGAPAESPVTKVLRQGKVIGLANHTRLRARDGTEIPIDDSGAPIRAEDGTITGVVLVFRDGSASARARVRRDFLARAGEALVASIDYAEILGTVARFAVPTLADWCTVHVVEPGATAPHQVAVAHADPAKVRWARGLGQRYPSNPDDPTGVAAVIRTGKSELYSEITREQLQKSARDAEHERVLRAVGVSSAMVVPLHVRGRTFGAMTFVHAESGRHYTQDDLSFAEDFARRAAMAIENAIALKEAEEGREREQDLRGEAELANRAKDEFLATVSHELRTPLTAILGWATLLRRRNPPPEIDRGLATIERNARLQTKLIEDVLDISRVISGKLVLNLSPVRLADIVAAAIETVTPAANLKGITIFSELAPGAPLIYADADRLQQVVWNILANAVKFTAKGGAVTVRGGREGSDVWLGISDTGEGIRPGLLPLLFEPFRQADASTTRRHGGLGLGLAIVRQLVLAHGGTVNAESEGEGHGTTFTVHLPSRAVVPAVDTGASSAAAAEPHVPGDDLSRLDGLRVLLVDDEQDALDVLGEVLGEQGAEVYGARSAQEALCELPEVHPDVLVSDIGMPGMDGFALMRSVRALPPSAGGQTRAIALTAFAREEDERRALAAGYQMHIAKPVEVLRLTRAIADVARDGRRGH
jgi:PAS domain S-box-containing protein